ncbi:MAG TPA: penicillin-binding transpeptidase domain-containing protein [Pyrinomonadaceae bacterium]|nr:penicillin-binding transpeptidase domain-containing protein [Pyrinomonadaceae bacterium]
MTRFSAGRASLKFLSAFLLFFLLLSVNTQGQNKKTSPASKNKPQSPTKTNVQDKTSAKKDSLSKKDKDLTAKKGAAAKEKSVKNDKKSLAEAKRPPENKKQIESKKQIEDKRQAQIRQAEEEKRREIEAARRREIEEARRQAALEEKRRREQLIREARARQIAFERGLRTETIENITADNTDGEDLEVRRAAVNALGKRAGTIVVLEPQTGRVLTVVNQDWAIHKSFKPCSTIKLVTAVAGINERMINEEGNIRSRRFPMNLNDALAYSNNIYFQAVGSNLGNKKMISYAQTLGLGQPTGINVAGETAGKLPYGNGNARIYSHGDDFEVSPLQLAVMVSAVSNHGKVIVPHVPRTTFERTNFRGTLRRQINLPQTSLQGVLPGMVGAATYGTARRGVDSSMGVAGKTGSCIADGSWVGLFTSVAPIENPQYAVVVITRGQSERGRHAAAVAGKIYQALRLRIRAKRVENIAKLALETKAQPQINAKTSAQIDEIAGEVSEDNDTAAKEVVPDEKEIIVGQTAQEVTAPKPVRKNVVKAGEKSSALFPTVVINVRKPQDEATRPRDEVTRPRIVTNK